ncbi:MAG TPA: TIGR01244 family phosphatase [Maritimibacter sp.]|nr:TIGR01244 family phosphatase [Maritimibacter sp.]
MNMNQLDDHVTVSPQITPADVADVKAAGFTAIMCNRPDGEDAGQPAFAEIEAAAKEAGLATYFAPIQTREEAAAAADVFNQALDAHDKLFAYCRSGTRCQLIYEAAKAMKAA